MWRRETFVRKKRSSRLASRHGMLLRSAMDPSLLEAVDGAKMWVNDRYLVEPPYFVEEDINGDYMRKTLMVSGTKPAYRDGIIVGTATTWASLDDEDCYTGSQYDGTYSVNALQDWLEQHEPETIVERKEGELVSPIPFITLWFRDEWFTDAAGVKHFDVPPALARVPFVRRDVRNW